jgi:hypothetical protein
MDDLSTDAADVKAALQSGFISQDIAQVSERDIIYKLT